MAIPWREILGVAIGGALGSLARFGVTTLLAAKQGGFPWAILVVNVVGCLLIGIVSQWAITSSAPDWLKVLLATGFLGGLTTFSTFGENTFRLLLAEHWLLAGSNIAANLLLGLAAVALGMKLAQGFS
jgi:CrcB protein